MPLRAALPPLQTAQSFACSVASLSRFPCHQLPGRRSLRCGALADCLLGQDGPSTRIAGRNEVPDTTSPSPRSGDRRALPLPAAETGLHTSLPTPAISQLFNNSECERCTAGTKVLGNKWCVKVGSINHCPKTWDCPRGTRKLPSLVYTTQRFSG